MIITFSVVSFAQETDSIQKNTKKHSLEIEFLNRYIWRGQSWGGTIPVVQPTFEYEVSKKITLGIWATSNFTKQPFYNDTYYYKGYQEIDVYVVYKPIEFLEFELWDFYWPYTKPVEGVNENYFNYNANSVKTIDFISRFKLQKWIKHDISFAVSTFLLGNDFRVTNTGELKQNFTTYVSFTYEKENLFQNLDLNIEVGGVLNNQAQYYSFGDYNKSSLINTSIKGTYTIPFSNKFKLPITSQYVYNPSKKNTDFYGQHFFIFGTSLKIF